MGTGIPGGMPLNAGDEAQGQKRGKHGAAAIADKGKNQTDNGNQTQTNAYVNEDLEEEHGGDADANQPVHIVRGFHTHIENAGDNGQKQEQSDNTADQPKLLADGGENGVRMTGRESVAVGNSAVKEAHACESTVS